MVIYPVESKCKAEFITAEAITECVGVCVCVRAGEWLYGAVNTVRICVHIGFSLIMLKCRGAFKNNP